MLQDNPGQLVIHLLFHSRLRNKVESKPLFVWLKLISSDEFQSTEYYGGN